MNDTVTTTVDTVTAVDTTLASPVVATPVAKPAKVAKVKVAKVAADVTPAAAKIANPGDRPAAAVLMAARKRVTFGASFINGVLGGVHRDVAKMVLLGKELGLGSKSDLSKLKVETLRERVGEAILAAETLPTSAAY
jgi:hypothetical protein